MPEEDIQLGGKPIKKVSSVKYLGLTIDHQLNYGEHIQNKIVAAKCLMFSLKGYIGRNWGPSPKMVRYAYISCVRPMLTYACFAFVNQLTKKNN